MARYTDEMTSRCFEIEPEDENYIEELINQAGMFRDFGTALDTYMEDLWRSRNTADDSERKNDSSASLSQRKSCTWNEQSIDYKVLWIKNRYREAGIAVPRNPEKWFEKNSVIEKKTAILFCMALGLDLTRTDDFLRRVCLWGRIDIHDMKELVYYFALKNGIPYSAMTDLLNDLPDVSQDRIPDGANVHYTGDIRCDVDSLESLGALSEYIHTHADLFAYNHATATDNVRRLWQRISGDDGIAASERRVFEVELPEEAKSNGFDRSLSVWSIYLQMTGLYGRNIRKTSCGRTIRRILYDSQIVHTFAACCYPDRDGLEKVLNGVHISGERMRKLLILLSFYEYLAGKSVSNGSRTLSGRDAEKCRLRMNDFLVSSGYSELYAGNPYDWIFLFALENDDPLTVFREDFMREVYYEWKSGQTKMTDIR